MVARLAASSVSIAAKGSGTGAGGAEADEHLAIVVDDVVDGQADQAGTPCSDDHHIVRELGEPRPPDRAATDPAPVAGPGQIPASEHPGPGPAAAYPARAGLRAAEPRPLRAGGTLTTARPGALPGAITTGARGYRSLAP